MKLLNRREQEYIRELLLGIVNALERHDPLHEIRVQEKFVPIVEKLIVLTCKQYEVYGAEESRRHINKTCDNLSKLSLDKEGNMNIDADEFIKMCSE